MANPATGPRFRLAPGVVLTGGRGLPLPGGIRNTVRDRAALAVTVDPVWLLAPLYARDAAGLHVRGEHLPGELIAGPGEISVTGVDLASAAADWPLWFTAALAYRPGTPAPRPEDLFAGSQALETLWPQLSEPFRRWVAARTPPPPDPAGPPAFPAAAVGLGAAVERSALTGFTAANGREPGRWTVRILQIPVAGDYLHSPESRRIVVSAALRADPVRYAPALAAELSRHF